VQIKIQENMFKNRNEAGKLLAKVLAKYIDKNVVVLALPRGGVVLGYEVAKALGCTLDIVVSRKVGHPSNPEYAICAVNEKGIFLCNNLETEILNKAWLSEEILRQKEEAGRRIFLYRNKQKPEDLKDKVIVLVDDGIATSLTMRLAVRSVKMEKPKKIIVAVPVAPLGSKALLLNEGADEVIILEPPEDFLGAVGSHYLEFNQVEDREVIEILKKFYNESSK
jgi:predicted phosphoribosyltransferase